MPGILLRWFVLVPMLVAGSAGLVLSARLPPRQAGRRPGQASAAGQFLRAVLQANYPAAYARLAPEVRQGLSPDRFAAAARPLWKSGQRHGTAIELYKLGVRLGDRGGARLFYTFSFVADSASKTPLELLEVTFRDTATRAVLGFSLHMPPKPVNTRPPVLPRGVKR